MTIQAINVRNQFKGKVREIIRGDVVSGPGGRQILLSDPAGNLVEVFQPAARPAASRP